MARSYVSQETKDRVFQAIEESGYRPNLLARNLATKRTQTLGLVVTNTLYRYRVLVTTSPSVWVRLVARLRASKLGR